MSEQKGVFRRKSADQWTAGVVLMWAIGLIVAGVIAAITKDADTWLAGYVLVSLLAVFAICLAGLLFMLFQIWRGN